MSPQQNRIYGEIQRLEDLIALRPKSSIEVDEIEHARALLDRAIGAGIPDQFFLLLQVYIRRFDRAKRWSSTEEPAGSNKS